MSDFLRLNVGGVIFQTTKSTLLSTRHNNFFHGLLSGQMSTTKDDAGNLFIDRDGNLFGPILSFLRTNSINIPNDIDRNLVLREAQFYSLDEMVQTMADSIKHNTEVDDKPNILKDGYYVGSFDTSNSKTCLAALQFFDDDRAVMSFGIDAVNNLLVFNSCPKSPNIWTGSGAEKYAYIIRDNIKRAKYWKEDDTLKFLVDINPERFIIGVVQHGFILLTDTQVFAMGFKKFVFHSWK